MSNWRDNPNLVACYENCVAMFRGSPEQSISSKIKERRIALGLSQRELAAHAGTNDTCVSRAENGFYSSGQANIISALDRLEQQ